MFPERFPSEFPVAELGGIETIPCLQSHHGCVAEGRTSVGEALHVLLSLAGGRAGSLAKATIVATA